MSVGGNPVNVLKQSSCLAEQLSFPIQASVNETHVISGVHPEQLELKLP